MLVKLAYIVTGVWVTVNDEIRQSFPVSTPVVITVDESVIDKLNLQVKQRLRVGDGTHDYITSVDFDPIDVGEYNTYVKRTPRNLIFGKLIQNWIVDNNNF